MKFETIARVYDRLAMLVFGRTWLEVQSAPSEYVQKEDHVLVVGGGSGYLLNHLHCKQVTYIELSPRMIRQARQRTPISSVHFVNADFLTWESDQSYDVIIYPFFLDCFQESSLRKVINKSGNLLVPEGMLIVLDFQKATAWKDFLVTVMYRFFRIFNGVEGRKLLPLRDHLAQNGFRELNAEEFLDGWVFCGSYKLGRLENS